MSEKKKAKVKGTEYACAYVYENRLRTLEIQLEKLEKQRNCNHSYLMISLFEDGGVGGSAECMFCGLEFPVTFNRWRYERTLRKIYKKLIKGSRPHSSSQANTSTKW